MACSAKHTSKILIAEENTHLNEQLAGELTARGYRVVQSYQGDQALVAALEQRVDIILLGALLPELDGFDVLQRLRKTCQIPVMMLTACDAEDERIQGYLRGADDCLSKPYSVIELSLKIEALLRRTRGNIDYRSEPQTTLSGRAAAGSPNHGSILSGMLSESDPHSVSFALDSGTASTRTPEQTLPLSSGARKRI
ncbi:response regulator transcription factor [Marinobacter sp.]|uniref:response regulator transcription factor n=1 Tax=Marinobacter sp. TaxID=50741 RepID=UPI003F95EBCA